MFHDGKTSKESDKIVDELFVNSREEFAFEEYNEDGVLIYRPPPLDEVWLSEPKCRARQEEIDKQCSVTHCRDELEMREMKRRVERSEKPLPGLLAESDIDSDSDNELFLLTQSSIQEEIK